MRLRGACSVPRSLEAWQIGWLGSCVGNVGGMALGRGVATSADEMRGGWRLAEEEARY